MERVVDFWISVLLLFAKRKLSVVQVMLSSRQAFRRVEAAARMGVDLRNTSVSSVVKGGVTTDDMAQMDDR